MTGQPNNAAAVERASTLVDLRRWDDAAAHLRTILATDPHNDHALCLMARAQLGQTAYDQALRTSLAAISENPENDFAYRLASLSLTRLGRDEEAQAMARNAVRLAPQEAHCHRILAQALVWSGSDLDEARAEAERAVSLAPLDASCHAAVGKVAAASARTNDAEAAFHRALAIDPDNAVAHNDLAKLNLETHPGSLGQAAAGFARAVRADPHAKMSRGNVNVVLHVFLLQASLGIFVVASIAIWVRSYSDGGLARPLPALLLVFPAIFVARSVFRLEPQLRGYLVRMLHNPFIACAVVCDALAALGLVVGAASQRASSIAFGCAAAFAILAQAILRVQMRRESRGRSAQVGGTRRTPYRR